MVSEKPSVGRALAAALGAHEKKDGYLQGGGYIVTWCIGHLVELARADAYDPRYTKWRREDLPILPAKFRHAVPKDKAKQLKTIAGLLTRPDVDTVICATDAGREGELIFRLVYDHCTSTKGGGRLPPIMRLWISSMEEAAIRDGFASLRPGADYENLYHAALCRAKADWLVGINATRLFSVLYGGPTLNVGRVQTPTLALLVEREAAIASFEPRPFYTVELECGGFTAKSEKLEDSAAVDAIRAACAGPAATVQDVQAEQKTTVPPKLYDLTTLQREANRLHGFTAQQTLDYAQGLYEKRLLTYPRTNSQYITGDMGNTAGAVAGYLQVNAPYAKGVKFTPDMERITNDAKVTDHHGLLPTMELASADLASLPAGEAAVLELVAARLLCATAPAHRYEAVAVSVICGGHTFKATGKTVLADGWKAIDAAFKAGLKKPRQNDTDEADPKDTRLPELATGQVFADVTATTKAGQTNPPARFTEDTLLSAMERAGSADMPDDAEHKGLGTPATRAGVIEKLVRGGFVQRQKRQLVPTSKGTNLVAVLPDVVKSPALTAEWEEKLLLIERGQLSPETFMRGICEMVADLVQGHQTPDESKKALFAAPPGEAVGICPRCGQSVHEARRGFFCSNKECSFTLWKDNRFFAAKGAVLTKATAAALLKTGRAHVSGLVSQKTGKPYSADVVMEDTGKYINFRLDFSGGKGAKGGR